MIGRQNATFKERTTNDHDGLKGFLKQLSWAALRMYPVEYQAKVHYT